MESLQVQDLPGPEWLVATALAVKVPLFRLLLEVQVSIVKTHGFGLVCMVFSKGHPTYRLTNAREEPYIYSPQPHSKTLSYISLQGTTTCGGALRP